MSGPRPGAKKPGLATLSPVTEARIVATLRYQNDSEETMADFALCGRFNIHNHTLTAIRRKYGLPSKKGAQVL